MTELKRKKHWNFFWNMNIVNRLLAGMYLSANIFCVLLIYIMCGIICLTRNTNDRIHNTGGCYDEKSGGFWCYMACKEPWRSNHFMIGFKNNLFLSHRKIIGCLSLFLFWIWKRWQWWKWSVWCARWNYSAQLPMGNCVSNSGLPGEFPGKMK